MSFIHPITSAIKFHARDFGRYNFREVALCSETVLVRDSSQANGLSLHGKAKMTSNFPSNNPDLAARAIGVGAIFVHEENGGPLRRHVGKADTKPNGLFPSAKARRSMVWEAMHQRDLLWIWEVDSNIVDFCSEPLRIELHTTAGPMVYFPDAMSLDANGGIEVIETKKSHAEVDKDPRYKEKLGLFRDACKAAGWKFRILDQNEIRREPRLSNARAIAMDRYTSVSTTDKMRLREAIDDLGGVIAYGEAVEALSRTGNPYDSHARARLHALIVQRFVTIDIDQRIDLFTPIQPGEPADETLSDVFAHLVTH